MLTKLHHYITSRRGKLALTYLGIIMGLTLVFSVVIYGIASRQFDRPLQRPGDMRAEGMARRNVDDLFAERATEARGELLTGLAMLNLSVLLLGVWLSTYLARLTMEPIEQAMAKQAQFVSDASHELRTPLTALQSINEVALRRKKITDSEARELATKNVAETAKLYALTSSLLGLVHAEQSTERQVVDVQAAVSDAMEHVVPAAQQKDVRVEDTVSAVRVVSQHSRLVQVIKIMLENAVKYSHAGGVVTIATKTQGHTVQLSVADTGVGIAKQHIPHIFNRFYRVDEARSQEAEPGYGIGLAIAKTISDQMGMNISVISKVGKGTTFTIELPLATEEA